MRAAVFHGAGDITIREVPVPRPGPGDLLLRVAAVGVCGTDAHEYAGGPHMYPSGDFIPGHEFSGEIVATGDDVPGHPPGSVVASGAGVSCGSCPSCRRGASNLCERYVTVGLQLPGALAGYVVVPAAICLDVSGFGLTAETAALAQPMAIAAHAVRRGRVEATDTVAIVGAGGIGAFLTYAVSRTSSHVTVFDLDEGRLEQASRLGATGVAHPGGRDASTAPTVVFEASGTPGGLRMALDLAGPGTRVVLLGIQGSTIETAFRDITLGEIEIIGTNAHVFATDFPEALRLLSSRDEPWSDVAPTVFPLDDVVAEGLLPLAEGRSSRIKTLIDPWAVEPRPTA